jgi:hypothetical protein
MLWIYNGIEKKFTILGHVLISRVMTLRNKKFGNMKYVMDLIVCNKKLKKFKVHHISKRIFSWPIINRGVQKGWK